MQKQSNDREQSYIYLMETVKSLGEYLVVDEKAVPSLTRRYALIRRTCLLYPPFFEYLCHCSQPPQEMLDKSIEELADYFVRKKALLKKDKDLFLLLDSLFQSMRYPEPNVVYDMEKVASTAPQLYLFLSNFILEKKSSKDSWWERNVLSRWKQLIE